MWLVIGKFVRGGGSPPRLPLSTSGCPENLANNTNSTLVTLLTRASSSALLPNLTTTPRSTHKTMYDISYCYSGVTGIIITLVISSLVSLCTGPLSPKALDDNVVNPSCARFYHWMWRRFSKCDDDEDYTTTPEH
ncbi:uncharacterized protein [Cherax quadricarinatus]|uniref:uncharacterized protein n=1 Tax=Cherax quadricarinatus TaxID=27406 RepID=UPI00387E5C60